MSEEQSEYVGGLLLIGFMHRLYEEYVDSSVLWLLKEKMKKKMKIDRRDIIAKLVGRSRSKLSDMDRSYTVKKSSSKTMMMMMMIIIIMMRRRRRRTHLSVD
jgi:hypothetical protein